MENAKTNPLIVQSDYTILLEVDNTDYELARDNLQRFSELVKSPAHIHTYKLTPLSVWNAAFAGMKKEDVISFLKQYSKYDIPPNVINEITEWYRRFGKVKLYSNDDETEIILSVDDVFLSKQIEHSQSISKMLIKMSEGKYKTYYLNRGSIKQKLLEIGYPVEDLVGYKEGEPFDFSLKNQTKDGKSWSLRNYQKEAAEVFYLKGDKSGGQGVVVLPCGSGKTVVGIAAMNSIRENTLIVCTNITACRQWINEIINRTNISKDDIGEYSSERKDIKPITVCTYQILVYRKSEKEPYIHFDLFRKKNWGLIIFDEVHLLPAPVFRIVAEIQSKRRLGLTATLVREDGKEKDIFSLIGPKRYDVPWKELEQQGFIANAECFEYRVYLGESERIDYIEATKRKKFFISSNYNKKIEVIDYLLDRHEDEQILIIGQYIKQLEEISEHFKVPLITGRLKNSERNRLYTAFRKGKIKVLVVSKVANYAIDLPDASVAIQVSGTFGSRQEEAQRLGRILRPKNKKAYFYSVVTKDTVEEEFANKRQLFFVEQGSSYHIEDWFGNPDNNFNNVSYGT